MPRGVTQAREDDVPPSQRQEKSVADELESGGRIRVPAELWQSKLPAMDSTEDTTMRVPSVDETLTALATTDSRSKGWYTAWRASRALHLVHVCGE